MNDKYKQSCMSLGTIMKFGACYALEAVALTGLLLISPDSLHAADHVASSTNNLPHRPVRIVLITPYGFRPGHITLSTTECYVRFINQTGISITPFPSSTDSDSSLHATMSSLQLDRLNWRGIQRFLSLPVSGVFHITELNHPDWQLAISIREGIQ